MKFVAKLKKRFEKRPMALAVLVALSVVWGCASAGYGRLARDAEVTQMFVANRVPSDFKYYIDGRDQMPYAIIGIKPGVDYETHLWQPVEPNTEDFAEKVKFIYNPNDWDKLDPAQGAWILDTSGIRVGIWYSRYPWTTVKVKNGVLYVLSPFKPSAWD